MNIGEKIDKNDPRLHRKLINFKLRVGDLVIIDNGEPTIYRITKDVPPRLDVTWGSYIKKERSRYSRHMGTISIVKHDWLNSSGKRVPYVYGSIFIKPVFSMFQNEKKPRNGRSILYDQLTYIKRLDISLLGIEFMKFQNFITDEIKRQANMQ